jgi:hypothetical protein
MKGRWILPAATRERENTAIAPYVGAGGISEKETAARDAARCRLGRESSDLVMLTAVAGAAAAQAGRCNTQYRHRSWLRHRGYTNWQTRRQKY